MDPLLQSPPLQAITRQTHLLGLPRELRDLIYYHYVHVDGGYKYDFQTNTLKQADGACVDVSLNKTCRQIASELKGLALSVNRITVSTYFSERIKRSAGLYHIAYHRIRFRRRDFANFLASRILTPDIAQQLTAMYPQSAPLIENWLAHEIRADDRFLYNHWGEAPSVHNDLLLDALNLLVDHPDALERMRSVGPRISDFSDPAVLERFTGTWPDPWSIPDEGTLSRMVQTTGVEIEMKDLNFHYSAAAAAIRFLKSIPATTRAEIRRIELLEDFDSVADPECHARGLIPFCQENPKLSVKRIVSLWRNALPISPDLNFAYNSAKTNDESLEYLQDDMVEARHVSKALGRWIAEAYALPSLGMPDGSFVLIFDGLETPEMSEQVLRVAQRDAAWQTALDLAYARGLLPQPSWLDRRFFRGYIYEIFPQVMQAISKKDSLVQCNFDLGEAYSPDALLAEHAGWSQDVWKEAWDSHQPKRFQTAPPYPSWALLRYESYIPQYQ